MRAIALAVMTALLFAFAVPAEAAKRESRYTDINGKDCISRGNGGLSCEGLGGWYLDIDDEGNIIELRVWRGTALEESLELIGRGLGEQVEWRGARLRKGFRTDALIVRLRPLEDDLVGSSLLVIIKLNPAGACFSGLVDARANVNANALARAAADKLPDVCDSAPQVYGKRTAATGGFGT